MKAGLGRPEWDSERIGRFRQCQLEVETKDDDGALLRVKPLERAIEKVAIGDEGGGVGDGRVIERCQLHLDDPSAPMPRRIDAGMHGEPVEPGIEPLRVAQPGQISPGPHQRLLDRVSREFRVPEDESGGCVQSREGRVDELTKGALIAPACPLDETSLLHGHPRFGATIAVALIPYGVRGGVNRSRPCISAAG